jgi:hypothetical protein
VLEILVGEAGLTRIQVPELESQIVCTPRYQDEGECGFEVKSNGERKPHMHELLPDAVLSCSALRPKNGIFVARIGEPQEAMGECLDLALIELQPFDLKHMRSLLHECVARRNISLFCRI